VGTCGCGERPPHRRRQPCGAKVPINTACNFPAMQVSRDRVHACIFCPTAEHYADELADALNDAICQDFNVEAEDGSPGLVRGRAVRGCIKSGAARRLPPGFAARAVRLPLRLTATPRCPTGGQGAG
jgi:hypothetical protein